VLLSEQAFLYKKLVMPEGGLEPPASTFLRLEVFLLNFWRVLAFAKTQVFWISNLFYTEKA